MKSLKKYGFISFCISAVSIIFSFSEFAFAEEVNYTNDTIINYTEKEVEVSNDSIASLALNFANVFGNNNSLTISSITPILDVNEIIVSYDVGFTYNNQPHGYVIIDLRSDGDYISEFNLNPGIEDFYDLLANEADLVTQEEYLIEIVPTEYSVINIEDDIVASSNGEVYSFDEFVDYYVDECSATTITEQFSNIQATSTEYDHANDVFNDYPKNFNITSQFYLQQFNSLTQDRVTSSVKKYACAVQAMAIIADSYQFYSSMNTGQLIQTYNSLWTKSGSSEDYKRNGISFGSTPTNKIGPGFVAYANEKGVALTYKITKSPSFSVLQNAVKNSEPALFSYFYNKPDGTSSGHTIFVQGAMSGKINNVPVNFIVAADGWTNSARYMNYSTRTPTLKSYEVTTLHGKKLFK